MPSSGGQTCALDRKSTRLNSSHTLISYAVLCVKKKAIPIRSEEHTSELQSHSHLVCRLLVVKKRPLDVTLLAQLRLAAHGFDFRIQAIKPVAESVFFNDTATTEIYTLSLHDALPI